LTPAPKAGHQPHLKEAAGMAGEAGKAPVLESARAGFGFMQSRLQANLIPAAFMAALGCGLYLAIASAAARDDVLTALVLMLPLGLLAAIYYVAQLRAALGQPAGPILGLGFGAPETQTFAAMAILGFFLFIVMLVAMIPGMVILSTAFAPFQEEMRTAQGDPAAVAALMQKVVSDNPWPFLLVFLLLGIVWMLLTSRLFLSAPATVAHAKITTFETWRWVDGNVWRLIAARLMLLAPIYLVLSILQQIVVIALGGEGAAQAGMIAAQFGLLFASNLFYVPAEAGLSAWLYKGLKPPTQGVGAGSPKA
jgi:hypothetical protein